MAKLLYGINGDIIHPETINGKVAGNEIPFL